MVNQKETNEKLVATMKQWQGIEDDSIKSTTEIIKISENPLVHLVMEIIRQDSVMHRRVQQLIIDHFEKKPITINPDELASFWDMVEAHDAMEKKTIKLAEESLENTNSHLAKYLLEYLLTDEKKHDSLLEEMEKIKKGMYPYGGM
jgi:hypothetical protein